MGVNFKVNRAEQQSDVALAVVNKMEPVLNQHGVMLNAVSQMLYEIIQRQATMEVVLEKLLGAQGLSAKDIIEAHIAEQEALRLEQEEAAGDEPTTGETTTAPGDTTGLTGVVEVPESADSADAPALLRH